MASAFEGKIGNPAPQTTSAQNKPKIAVNEPPKQQVEVKKETQPKPEDSKTEDKPKIQVNQPSTTNSVKNMAQNLDGKIGGGGAPQPKIAVNEPPKTGGVKSLAANLEGKLGGGPPMGQPKINVSEPKPSGGNVKALGAGLEGKLFGNQQPKIGVSGPQETKSGPSINVSSPDDQPKNNFAANKAALNNLFIPGGGKPQKCKSWTKLRLKILIG